MCRQFFIFITLCFFAQASQAFDKQNIISDYQAFCIAHSAKHGLFVGAEGQVLFVNQNQIHPINVGTTNNITALCTWGDSLYIGTNTGELIVLNLYTMQFNKLNNFSAPILSIYQLDNKLQIGTMGKGLIEKTVQGGTKNIKQLGNIIFDIKRINGVTYLASEKGFFRYTSSRATKIRGSGQMPDQVITNLSQRGDTILLGTQLGYVYGFHKGVFYQKIKPKEIKLSNQISGMQYYKNKIWISTHNGLYSYQQNFSLDSITYQKPMYALLLAENELWAGGENFLAKSNQEIFSKQDWLKGIQRIYFFENKKYAVQKGKLFELQNKKQRLVKNFGDDITGLLQHQNGLWVGTINKGLFYRANAQQAFKKCFLSSSQAADVIIEVGGNGKLTWVITLDGIWYSKNYAATNQFIKLKLPHKNKFMYAYSITYTDDEFIVSSDGGELWIFDGNLDYKKSVRLDTKTIYNSLQDKRGTIWANTADKGVFKIANDSTQNFQTTEGILSNDNHSMLFCNDSIIALVSDKGVSFVHTKNNGIDNYPFDESMSAGINTAEYYDGKLWIPTEKYLLQMSIDYLKLFSAPRAHIEKISVSDKVLQPRAQLKHDENIISLWINAITNQNRKVYSRYRLKGLNSNWIMTRDAQIVFSKLPTGSYRFELQSSFDKNFSTASTTTFTFKIQKAFWQEVWFWMACGAFTLFIIYLIQHSREKRIKRMAQLQKDKVVAEYQNLRNQVNPHFLFNNFNTLVSLIYDNPDDAVEYTQHLSKFYRQLIEDEKQLLPISKEIEHLNNYFYLQKIRMGDSVELFIEDELQRNTTFFIPSLTLQLLCENAIKHNAADSANPLKISLKRQNNFLLFSNNINPRITPTKGLGMGLLNIKKRYELFSHRAVVVSSDEEYFKVQLPIIVE